MRALVLRAAALAASAVIAATAAAPPSHAQPSSLAPDSTIRAIIKGRVDAKLAAGMMVGVIDPDGRRRVVAYGSSGTARPLDGSTVFEIGSVSKTFTGNLLAEMARRGEVRLDDPVAKYLPAGVKVPSRNGREITLLELGTQSSGLPRNSSAFRSAEPGDPTAAYTPEGIFAFLSTHELRRDVGAQYEYSNIGYMLLSHALTQAARAPTFEDALVPRVLDPLGLRDTRVVPTPSMRERLALGHDEAGAVVPPVSISPTLSGVGMLRSTMNDMLAYVAANMAADVDSTRGALASALRSAHVRRREAGPNGIGLAWQRRVLSSGDTLVWHDGGTGGFRAFAGYDPRRRTGIVILVNSAIRPQDIAYHLMDPALPLRPPQLPAWAALKEVTLPAATLDQYVGTYSPPERPSYVITISREGERLTFESTAQSKRPMSAEKEDAFFLKGVDVRITFQRDDSGRVTGLVMRVGGQDRAATKTR
jgi:serine-type D-Ala-D-Ala carboxypeptidase/endopeptidase